MKTHLRNPTPPKSDKAREIGLSQASREALLLLAANSQDPCALVAIYDASGDDLRAAVARWFGRDFETYSRAINSILAEVARRAPSYDSESMDVSEWIHQCAEAEARRLREALNGASTRTVRARRAK